MDALLIIVIIGCVIMMLLAAALAGMSIYMARKIKNERKDK